MSDVVSDRSKPEEKIPSSVKSWDEISTERKNLQETEDQCLHDEKSDYPIIVCMGKTMGAWDQQLNDVYRKAHEEMQGKPKADQLLTDSQNKYMEFMKKEDDLIEKINPLPEPVKKDYAAMQALRTDKIGELESNFNSSGFYFDNVFANHCLQKAKTVPAENMCIKEGLAIQHREMNRVEKELLDRLTPEEQDLVKESQKAWKQYHDAERLFIDEVHPLSKIHVNKQAAVEKMQILTQVLMDRTSQLGSLYLGQNDRPDNR